MSYGLVGDHTDVIETCKKKYGERYAGINFGVEYGDDAYRYHIGGDRKTKNLYRVFDGEVQKEIQEEGASLIGRSVSRHERSSICHLIPKNPIDMDKEGDIEIWVRSQEEYTRTSSNGDKYIVSPETSVSIHQIVDGKDKVTSVWFSDVCIDVSDKKRVAALLNGVFGKPRTGEKNLPEVLKHFNNFIYRENDLSAAKKRYKEEIASYRVAAKERRKRQKVYNEQNVENAKLRREEAKDNSQIDRKNLKSQNGISSRITKWFNR